MTVYAQRRPVGKFDWLLNRNSDRPLTPVAFAAILYITTSNPAFQHAWRGNLACPCQIAGRRCGLAKDSSVWKKLAAFAAEVCSATLHGHPICGAATDRAMKSCALRIGVTVLCTTRGAALVLSLVSTPCRAVPGMEGTTLRNSSVAEYYTYSYTILHKRNDRFQRYLFYCCAFWASCDGSSGLPAGFCATESISFDNQR